MKPTDWISVKDKLPKLEERVLVCRKLEGGSTYVDFAMRVTKTEYLPNIDKYITQEKWNVEDIIYWQKITLPKKEKEN
jgi:hypothetical protein